MASRTALHIAAAAMAAVVVGALLPATASAANYKVGDDFGWDWGMDYNAWASRNTFKVSDIIEFVYTKGLHNVVQVDEASYNACTVPNNAKTWISGVDAMQFDAAGQYFFICGVDNHCQTGMKLALNVVQ